MLNLEVICEFPRLEEIESQWLALSDRIPRVSPFQLPDWQLAWWRHFGSGQLRTFAFWRDGQLVGLIPLFLHEWNNRRQLTLLGSGVSDYLEPLIHDAGVVPSFSTALLERRDWDVANWQDLHVDTPLQHLSGLLVEVQDDTPCSAIPLTGTFEDYWSCRSSDLRRNIKRYARRAEAESPLLFAVEQTPAPASVEALIRLHGARWQRQGEAGTIESNNSAGFLRDISHLPSCRIFTLHWKNEIVAITAGFLRGDRVYSYLSAFDPQYEILGFGRYLLYRSLQWARDQGFQYWDFLRGEESYKASWGAQVLPKRRLLITRF